MIVGSHLPDPVQSSIMQLFQTRMETAQAAIDYAAPITVLTYCLGASAVSFCTLQKGHKPWQSRSRRAITYSMYFVLVTYAVQSGVLVLDSLSNVPSVSSVAGNASTRGPSSIRIFPRLPRMMSLANLNGRSMQYHSSFCGPPKPSYSIEQDVLYGTYTMVLGFSPLLSKSYYLAYC